MAPLPANLLPSISHLPVRHFARHADPATATFAHDLSLLPKLESRVVHSGSESFKAFLASIGLQVKVDQSEHGGIRRRSFDSLKPHLSTLTVPLSPRDIDSLVRRKDIPHKDNIDRPKGGAAIDPYHVNNKGFFALFALIGTALVLVSIWFFFVAKNGGFVFRQGDWDEYKSTVLRRKDANGKTLSNATKTTNLGGGSVTGEYDAQDMANTRRGKVGRDADVREYRHEKPARVGGLNRKADGSGYDPANTATDRSSETMTAKSSFIPHPSSPPQKKKRFFNRAKDAASKPRKVFRTGAANKAKAAPVNQGYAHTARTPSSAYSFTNGTDDNSTIADSASEFAFRRSQPRAQPHASRPYHHSRTSSPHYAPANRSSPRHTSRSPHKRPSMPGTFSDYESGDEVGTKTYSHFIPGLSQGVRTEESASEAGSTPGRGARGFRRGGGGRRDSLSDSD
ncbi:MAG: hypothetical protein M1833_003535 [Piccolia ochrophora]|nr:MAG: hypothetical protein M1833_003535 [Piccolia ochrophora]